MLSLYHVINGVRVPLTTHTSIRVSPSVKITCSVVCSVMIGLPVSDNQTLKIVLDKMFVVVT